jgi:hypothetical protein
VAADEFLMALGADLDELAARTPYRDLAVPSGQPGRPSPHINPVMYGMCGVYVLEDWGAATWSTGYRKVRSMWPRPGQEIVCVTVDRFSPPSKILHVPGDEIARRVEFGQDTGEESALDAALDASGAVFPSIGDVGEAAVVAHYEQHGPRLPALVFAAVGAYCGLTIDQEAVRAGALSGALLSMP